LLETYYKIDDGTHADGYDLKQAPVSAFLFHPSLFYWEIAGKNAGKNAEITVE
jgi:hypothetical protein